MFNILGSDVIFNDVNLSSGIELANNCLTDIQGESGVIGEAGEN